MLILLITVGLLLMNTSAYADALQGPEPKPMSFGEKFTSLTVQHLNINTTFDRTNSAARADNNNIPNPTFQTGNLFMVNLKYSITPGGIYRGFAGERFEDYYRKDGGNFPIVYKNDGYWGFLVHNLIFNAETGYTNTVSNTSNLVGSGAGSGISFKTEDRTYWKVGVGLSICIEDIWKGFTSGKTCSPQ